MRSRSVRALAMVSLVAGLSCSGDGLPEVDGALAQAVDPLLVAALRDKHQASSAAGYDRFGTAVAVDGNWAVVGAPHHQVGSSAEQGAAYVFARDAADTWYEVATLTAGGAGYHFGASVAISGDRIVAGAPDRPVGSTPGCGAAYVFTRSGSVWSAPTALIPSSCIHDQRFGEAVAVSGGRIVVGVPGRDPGAFAALGDAAVYAYNGASWAGPTWLLQGNSVAGDQAGASVAISGNRIVVGVPYRDGPGAQDQGAAAVFEHDGAAWVGPQWLADPYGAAGDHLGASVAILGDTIVAGVPDDDLGSNDQGSASVFVHDGAGWSGPHKLLAPDGAGSDHFGRSVATSGDAIVVGAPDDDDGGAGSGSAYAFLREAGVWSAPLKLPTAPGDPSDAAGRQGDAFGSAVALWSDRALLGAPSDNEGFPGSGSVYFFSLRRPQGTPCGAPWECVSGSCADGVCCDADCTGLCQACTQAKRGDGDPDGQCGPILAGLDPDGECDAESQASCGRTGVCSGTGQCSLHPQNTVCKPASCAADGVTEDLPDTCDGAGTCVDQGTQPCGDYACAPAQGACLTQCAGDADCAPGRYCDNAVCAALKAPGQACLLAHECASGFCADGVCCDSACLGVCQACSAEHKAAGPSGSCGPRPAGAACAPASCASDLNLLLADTCSAAGACVDGGAVSCDPFTCDAGACRTSCAADAECAPGHYCDGDQCLERRPIGQPCAEARECQTGVCADGVCCNAACAGPCESCAAADTGHPEGTCHPVRAGADPGDECEDEGAASCGTTGACDGAGACARYPAGAACGAASCAADGITRQRPDTCDGSGACVPGGVESCAPYRCEDGECGVSCVDDAGCVEGAYCEAGLCHPGKEPGDPCTGAFQCASGFCADGVCCGAACDGACMTCAASGSAGVCTAIPEDQCVEIESTSGGGCTCRGAGAPASGPAGALLALAAAAGWAARRGPRRSSQRRAS